MNVRFSSRSRGEYLDLHAQDGKLFAKLNGLIEECRRHPFNGTGKPEPLGGNLSGWWSRRISHEHRGCIGWWPAGRNRCCRWRSAGIIIEAD